MDFKLLQARDIIDQNVKGDQEIQINIFTEKQIITE